MLSLGCFVYRCLFLQLLGFGVLVIGLRLHCSEVQVQDSQRPTQLRPHSRRLAYSVCFGEFVLFGFRVLVLFFPSGFCSRFWVLGYRSRTANTHPNRARIPGEAQTLSVLLLFSFVIFGFGFRGLVLSLSGFAELSICGFRVLVQGFEMLGFGVQVQDSQRPPEPRPHP